jgi:hypothetical protein
VSNQSVRFVSLWMLDIALADDAFEREEASTHTALQYLKLTDYIDDRTLMVWKWQVHVEEKYGPESVQAAKALIHIGELLQDKGAYGQANAIFERSLAIAQAVLSPDSEGYQQIRKAIDLVRGLAASELAGSDRPASVEKSPIQKQAVEPRGSQDSTSPLNHNNSVEAPREPKSLTRIVPATL